MAQLAYIVGEKLEWIKKTCPIQTDFQRIVSFKSTIIMKSAAIQYVRQTHANNNGYADNKRNSLGTSAV